MDINKSVTCYCFMRGCWPLGTSRSKRSATQHLERDRSTLAAIRADPSAANDQDLIKNLLQTIHKTERSLNALDDEDDSNMEMMGDNSIEDISGPMEYSSTELLPSAADNDNFERPIDHSMDPGSPQTLQTMGMPESSSDLSASIPFADAQARGEYLFDLDNAISKSPPSDSDDDESIVSHERVALVYSDYDSEDENELQLQSADVNDDHPRINNPPSVTIPHIPLTRSHISPSTHNLTATTPALETLREDLREGYTPSTTPPPIFDQPSLNQQEELSLRHFAAWQESNGTVNAYNLHARVLEMATGVEILSLYNVEKLVEKLSRLEARRIDMCPKSCIAYTGKYADLSLCPYVSSATKNPCNFPRYRGTGAKRQPRAQFTALSPFATVQALYANNNYGRLMRNRANHLKQVLHLLAKAGGAIPERDRMYSDFGNSYIHVEVHHKTMGLFQDSRDVAFALSTDGAQLTMKKHSNTWILILILLNLPAELRYQSKNVIINFAIPGPNSPGDVESFMWPLFQDFARAAEGIWIWDAIDSAYFLMRAYATAGLGDMLGSAKMNGMAGHVAVHGDRFTMVQGAKSSNAKGKKAQYYPILKGRDQFNPDRPQYTYDNLPMRTHDGYFKILNKLEQARNENQRRILTKATGISRLPLCAASLAFFHPAFFPLDPFHLIYENCTAFIWDLWTTETKPHEITHLPAPKAAQLGAWVADAMSTLPPAFCGPIRDVYLKRQSQYKVYEWMALLHWYFVPMALELNVNMAVVENLSKFVQAMEFAMTIKPRSEQELWSLRDLIVEFLSGFERLYIGDDPSLNSRARLCIFQLIHIPMHIKWKGSIRVISQATVERGIGEMSHKIRSKKNPFANLTNLIIRRERSKILSLYYPTLFSGLEDPQQAAHSQKSGHFQSVPLRQSDVKKDSGSPAFPEIVALFSYLGNPENLEFSDIRRWGKFRLPNGRVLQSQTSYARTTPSRKSCWFSGISNSRHLVIGECQAFYQVLQQGASSVYVVFRQIEGAHSILSTIRGSGWSSGFHVLPVEKIHDLVGIWKARAYTYILQKHSALDLLTEEEAGLELEADHDHL